MHPAKTRKTKKSFISCVNPMNCCISNLNPSNIVYQNTMEELIKKIKIRFTFEEVLKGVATK